ncbi:MAG: four helix bundle protein [Burkholderiales bacterium]
MNRIERFEDLIAWQKARVLTRHIYLVTQKGRFARDHRLSDQIQSASVSVMSNLAEGFERGTRREFHQYLVIAKASCGEVRSQLYVGWDVGYLTKPEFERLSAMTIEIGKIIGGLRAAVKRQRDSKK